MKKRNDGIEKERSAWGGIAQEDVRLVGERIRMADVSAHTDAAQHTGCMRTIKLAVIPGDGIGKEVVPEGLKVLTKVLEGSDLELETTQFDLGADRWHRTGDTLTDEDLEAIRETTSSFWVLLVTRRFPPVSLSAVCC